MAILRPRMTKDENGQIVGHVINFRNSRTWQKIEKIIFVILISSDFDHEKVRCVLEQVVKSVQIDSDFIKSDYK